MTNAEKNKGDAERRRAYEDFCYSHEHCDDCPAQDENRSCYDIWLHLESLVEEPTDEK